MKTLLASAKERWEIECCYGLLSNHTTEEEYDDDGSVTVDLDHIRSIGASASVFHAYIILQYKIMRSWRKEIPAIKKGKRPHNISDQFAEDLLLFAETGWFPLPSKNIEKEIRMSPARQGEYLKILRNAELLKTVRKGVPPRRFVLLMKQVSIKQNQSSTNKYGLTRIPMKIDN